VAREFYSFKFKRHPALRDIAGSELTEPILPLNVQSRRLFHIKLANDDEVKQILGTRAVEPIAGSLFILDGDDVVGRFTEGVERWW
jgi:hypothetical protein